MAPRLPWSTRRPTTATTSARAAAGTVVSAKDEGDSSGSIVEPILTGASMTEGELDGLEESSKFDKIWNNNGPTSSQERLGKLSSLIRRSPQLTIETDKSTTACGVEEGVISSSSEGLHIGSAAATAATDNANTTTAPIKPIRPNRTTRLEGEEKEDLVPAGPTDCEEGGNTSTTAATAAAPHPPSMFHLKRWSPPPRRASAMAAAASSPSASSTSDYYPRVVKHANSGDLEATQVSDADLGDVGNALDGNYDCNDSGCGGSAGCGGDGAVNNSRSSKNKGADEEEANSADDSGDNGNVGIEMSLRQYLCARMLSRRRYLARMASWRDSVRDLKQRRRRCFWSTVALVALVLLLIVIVASSCGSGRCSSTRQSAAASTGAETADPKFGRLTDAPTAAPPGATSPPSTGTDDSGADDDDSVVSQHDPLQALLGGSNPNIVVFKPTMSPAEIQAAADAIFYQQQNNEMGTERYTLYFMPGSYGSYEQPLYLQIGYYTEVSGLGANPEDVMVYGKIEVYNRCFEQDPYKQGLFVPSDGSGLCFALNSFWRSLSNLSIQIVSLNQDSCRATAMFWAVSQAVSMRRVDIRGGDVSLMDYCTNPAFASGGFIADSRAGKVISGSQQQFVARNMDITYWEGSVWNQVFLGVAGAPADTSFPEPAFTVFATTPVKREKPYIYTDASGAAYVHVPSLELETIGVSWASGSPTPGTSLPLSDFFVADPSHPASAINRALRAGKNLILSPGVYDIADPIIVDRDNAVVLGMGHATLTAINGVTPLQVRNRPGIIIAGVTLDAGETLSESLLEVGSPDEDPTGDIANPITLSDVYFRLGGPHIGKAKACLTVNANDVLIDHTWVWRADHGVEDFDPSDGFMGDNQRWAVNVGEIGVVVNGDDVVANGLFVEHYQQYNVLWKGERGRVYFFQNELPYDPPTQADWTAADGTQGWAAYKVDDAVTDHQLWAGGVYCYNRNNPDIVTANAFEVPQAEGVQMQRVFTRNLSGPGTILSIVNGMGESVTNQTQGPHYTDYLYGSY